MNKTVGIWDGGTVAETPRNVTSTGIGQDATGRILKSKIIKLKKKAREYRGIIVGLNCPDEQKAELMAHTQAKLTKALDGIDLLIKEYDQRYGTVKGKTCKEMKKDF